MKINELRENSITRVKNKDTDLVYEAQPLVETVLVRQVGTGMIEQLTFEDFEENYDECYGCSDERWDRATPGPSGDGDGEREEDSVR